MAIGFGAYRISIKSDEHKEALKYALENGLDFIDTSANYTDGQSEKLIGEVLKSFDNKPFLMSKVGYIQGNNIEIVNQLNQVGIAKDDLVKVNDGLWHSIHPDFIRNQIELSLERLQVDKIDAYLLHNPEYYFYEDEANQEEYYRRISLAFEELETLVAEGKIDCYGISSNNFVLSPSDPKVTNLERVYECAKNIKDSHSFKWIQFPFNLIEIGALEKYYNGLSLVDMARAMGLSTAINRPLNSFKDNSLLRLASYEPFLNFMTKNEGEELFQTCLSLIGEKLQSENEDESPLGIPLFKQFSEMYHDLPSEDAVQQVYMAHFFPLVARIWGGDLTPSESEPFYELYDYSLNRSRYLMSLRAESFEKQAIEAGLLDEGEEPLQIKAINKYLQYGFDRILVGMKRKIYVDQFKAYFQ